MSRFALVQQGTLNVGTGPAPKTDIPLSVSNVAADGSKVTVAAGPFDPNAVNLPLNVHWCLWSGGLPAGMTASQAVAAAQFRGQTQFPVNADPTVGVSVDITPFSPLAPGSYSYLVLAEYQD